jgi:hypothetical protein
MSTEDQMTIDERYKYLRRLKKHYLPAGRKERSMLLDEMERATGLHRKSLIRLLSSDLQRQPRRQPRGRKYGAAVRHAVFVIAESLDYICAERLTPNLAWLAEHLAQHGEIETTSELLVKLGQVSVSTVERMLAQQRRDQPRLPRPGPRRANRLREIPMLRLPWQEQRPGHFETDLVHHCGPSTSGEYVHTLQLIDVATGWSERVAVLGRGYVVMQDAFRRVLARLPFPVLEIHPDNGSEFLSAHMLRFWQQWPHIRLSRSRPWHKNDNPRVEQKNYTLVRAYLGYERLDSVAQTVALNHLYDRLWLYYNFFQPVLHLTEKTVIRNPDGSTRVKRKYDPAKTPLDRLCATEAILPTHAEQLRAWRDDVNPRQLRQEIQEHLDRLWTLPGAQPGVTEDVYQTLFTDPQVLLAPDNPGRLAFDRTPQPASTAVTVSS